MMKGTRHKAQGKIFQFWTMKLRFLNGEPETANGMRFLFFAFCLFTFAFFFPAAAFAQPEDELEIAPPPVKTISKMENQQLEAEPNVKKHTQLALNLMEARLKSAESLTTENNYREALNTLGGFQILLEKTLGFLSKNDTESDKVQNNFKRLELSLRGHVSRLEILRRAMPSKFAYYVQKLIKVVREARAKAVEPLFDDTVVPERKP
jgi:hypothetical protein